MGFIASAFKPSKTKLTKKRTVEIFNTGVTTVSTYLLQAVFRIVYDEYGFRPDHESLNYYRFVTHLKFYARRIVSGEGYGDEDSDLLDVVRFKYPKAYACADKIRVYVQREKNFHSGQNELLYLTIHIARVMEHPDEK